MVEGDNPKTTVRNRLPTALLLSLLIAVPILGTLAVLVDHGALPIWGALIGAFLAGDLKGFMEEVIIRGR